MTHEFLAEMLGVRRSTVSEVLEPFQEKGLIRYSRGKFTVLDRDGLMAGSCECYRRINEEFRACSVEQEWKVHDQRRQKEPAQSVGQRTDDFQS